MLSKICVSLLAGSALGAVLDSSQWNPQQNPQQSPQWPQQAPQWPQQNPQWPQQNPQQNPQWNPQQPQQNPQQPQQPPQQGRPQNPQQNRQGQVWQPAVGSRWQIVTKNSVSVDPASAQYSQYDAQIYDVDLFNTPQEVIQYLKYQNKKVICYFSAGTGEDWRPDYRNLNPADLGPTMNCWPGERWLNVRSNQVWSVMQSRIQLARSKGCDAIDPDNLDSYASGGGGFNLTERDAINYLQKIAGEARRNGLATGLKNAEPLLPSVMNDVQFAVNEGCQTTGECAIYNSFIAKGKPVFHIEYAKYQVSQYGQLQVYSDMPELQGATAEQIRQVLCLERNLNANVGQVDPRSFSTVIKTTLLDGFALYCDGSSVMTPTMNVNTGGPQYGGCERRNRVVSAEK